MNNSSLPPTRLQELLDTPGGITNEEIKQYWAHYQQYIKGKSMAPEQQLEKRVANLETLVHILMLTMRETLPAAYAERIMTITELHFTATNSLGAEIKPHLQC